jgi:hypothetical protein
MAEKELFLLEAEEGEREGETFEVPERGFTIGRSAGCELTLRDRMVSRRHARIHRRDGRWFVEDLDSSNGILVNGIKSRRERLVDGDLLEIGSSRFRFHREETERDRTLADAIQRETDRLETEGTGSGIEGSERLSLHPFVIAGGVFVFLSWVFWGFALGGVVLGILAAIEIRNSEKHTGKALAVIVVVAAALGGVGNAFVRAGGFSLFLTTETTSQRCKQNLGAIGEGLQSYAAEHEGSYPETLDELYPEHVGQLRRLSCPAVSEREPGTGYLFPAAGANAPAPETVVVCDGDIANHKSR